MAAACDAAVVVSLRAARDLTGRSLVYHRTIEDEDFDVVAIPGSSEFAEQQDAYAIHAWQSHDWLCPVADIGGVPGPSDYVVETMDGRVRRFDLMAPPGVQPWKFVDRGRVWVRLHTKLVSETDA